MQNMNYYYDFSGQKFGYPLSLCINGFERQVFSRQSSLEISYVLKGTYEVVTEHFSHVLKAGELVLIAPEGIHRIRKQGEGEHVILTIHIDFSRIPEAMTGNVRDSFCTLLCTENENTVLLHKLETKIGELLMLLTEGEKNLFRMNRMMMELAELASGTRSADMEKLPLLSEQQENYMKAIRYIDRNYQKELRLSDVAKTLSFSVPYTSKLFRKYTGVPFVKYLAGVRVRASLESLLEGKDSIETIAGKCGMPSAKAYTTVFKEMYGVVPSVYRKQFQRNLRYSEGELAQEMCLEDEQRKLLAHLLECAREKQSEDEDSVQEERVLYRDEEMKLSISEEELICRLSDGVKLESSFMQEDGAWVLRMRKKHVLKNDGYK